ncbi:hypothetical protein Q1695_014747 [Nippostrongylus brasiliensis]|nr:hypothetical protein Q1695_014747 [Nippostrongylus brasiliensis]
MPSSPTKDSDAQVINVSVEQLKSFISESVAQALAIRPPPSSSTAAKAPPKPSFTMIGFDKQYGFNSSLLDLICVPQ